MKQAPKNTAYKSKEKGVVLYHYQKNHVKDFLLYVYFLTVTFVPFSLGKSLMLPKALLLHGGDNPHKFASKKIKKMRLALDEEVMVLKLSGTTKIVAKKSHESTQKGALFDWLDSRRNAELGIFQTIITSNP